MRRRHRRLTSEADLDVTPFLNLMIVLVPVLLMSVVFARTTIIELNFPRSSGAAAEEQPIRPVVVIAGQALVVTDSEGHVLREIPALPGIADEEAAGDEEVASARPDYAQLLQVMKQLKSRWPEQEDITVKSTPDTHYQTLIGVMDTVRSFHTVEVTSLVEVKLFPNISVGDAPPQLVGEVSP
ncbi:ExbD/TolR family protein [Marinobacter segnicrescens]|uniref:ExbD/TolR family protein n=1 Tax=Marinobacter segnicrescens TaxID=430453 RepID=UPI003A91F2EF